MGRGGAGWKDKAPLVQQAHRKASVRGMTALYSCNQADTQDPKVLVSHKR